MTGSGFEVLGDVARLGNLSETQVAHRNTFIGILEDIRSHNTTVKNQWEGEGLDQKDADDKSYEDHYQQAMAAFDKLIGATDESAESWRALLARMGQRFTR